MSVKLTQYSHGAGCGCKISPAVLDTILHSDQILPDFPALLVGNQSRDDAAVMDLGNGTSIVSTTDFFMPIVDDPFDFGRIAATNAISDIYAMGGKPLMAIAILGWPVNVLAPEVARQVVSGGRQICAEAGIPLAGGHSIDSPEPIFGLAVTGIVNTAQIKRNDTATSGCLLYLTKPLGIGILSTAQKKGLITSDDLAEVVRQMTTLNTIGAQLAELDYVKAMTDVTGFGLLGHLLEMCEGSGLGADITLASLPLLPNVDHYREQGAVPGGTERNFASYGHKVAALDARSKALLCDPQTSGGLLVAVDADYQKEFEATLRDQCGLQLSAMGVLKDKQSSSSITIA